VVDIYAAMAEGVWLYQPKTHNTRTCAATFALTPARRILSLRLR